MFRSDIERDGMILALARTVLEMNPAGAAAADLRARVAAYDADPPVVPHDAREIRRVPGVDPDGGGRVL